MDGDNVPYQALAQVTWRCFKLTKNIEIIKGSQFPSLMTETTKLLILALGTFPSNLKSKELKV